jgi:hypothetical protein
LHSFLFAGLFYSALSRLGADECVRPYILGLRRHDAFGLTNDWPDRFLAEIFMQISFRGSFSA